MLKHSNLNTREHQTRGEERAQATDREQTRGEERAARQGNMNAARSDAGYTLLELLVVLAIIGTLIGLVAPRLIGQVNKSQVIAAQSQAKTLRLALDSFRLDTGRYPSAQEGLSVLSTPPVNDNGSWYGPYMEKAVPQDPWGNAYIYQPPIAGENGRMISPVVISYGADGVVGGSGNNADISS